MFILPSYSPLFTMGLLADRSAPSPVEPTSAIYFTLQKGRRDTLELRSFLYLDLADPKCRAPSHRRKPSALSKSTSWTCLADASESRRTATPTPIVARRRASKESLRSIPSPKPAPSATLPDVPACAVRRPGSVRSDSVSSQARRRSRMEALARLEGRSRVHCRSTLRNNFMSFSDDEEEPRCRVEEGFADIEDEADAVVPLRRETRPARPRRKRRSTIEKSWFPLKSFMDLREEEVPWNWRSFIEIGGVA